MGHEPQEKPRPGPPRAAHEVAPVEGVVVPVVRCPYCRDAITAGDPGKLACNACMAWHHQACWTEHGRCAGCGASASGPAANAEPREVPVGVASSRTPTDVDPVLGGWLVSVTGGLCALMTLVLTVRGLFQDGAAFAAVFFFLFVVAAGVTWFGVTLVRDGRRQRRQP